MNGPREIDLAVVPEDRRMVNDPRSTAENNVSAREGPEIVEIPRGGMSAEQLRDLGFEVPEEK